MKISDTSGWLSDRCRSFGITRCRIKLSDRIGFDDIGSLRLRISRSFDDIVLLFRAATLLCLGWHTFLGLFYVIVLCNHHLGSAQVDQHFSSIACFCSLLGVHEEALVFLCRLLGLIYIHACLLA